LALATEPKRRATAARTPAFGVALDDLMGYNLRLAHGVQKQRFAAVFGPLGIRPLTLSVLGAIYDTPGITQAELGKKLKIKRANMVPVMAELQGRGLIARRPSDNDLRGRAVKLTPAGVKFTIKVLELHRRLEDDLCAAFGLRERDQLLQLLKKFRKLSTEPELGDTD
jgi:DNA-binding MarR family transcriptional regulator